MAKSDTPATPGAMNRRQQIAETYRITKRTYPRIGLVLLGTFLLAGAIGFTLFKILPGSGVIEWILSVIGGLLLEEDCQCKLRSIATYAFTVGEATAQMSLQDKVLDAGAVRLRFGVLKVNKAITELDLSGAGIAAKAAHIVEDGLGHGLGIWRQGNARL